jgi:lambda repressor-like predicted transcriptional regulator
MDNFDFKKYLSEGRIHKDLNLNEKKDSKKGNENEQKRMEGAIKDDRDHIKNLKKDIESNESKLSRLKKDYKRDVVKEDEQYNEVAGIPSGLGMSANNDLVVAAKKIAAAAKKAGVSIADFMKKHGWEVGSMQSAMASESLEEDARTDAEEEGYKDGMKDEKADMKKMKVSELKAKIKEQILAELSLSEDEEEDDREDDELSPEELANKYAGSPMREADEEVDVDIDVEDEVDVDVEADDIEIEKKGTDIKVEVGLSPEEELIQDSLKAAMDAANSLGNDKLADQIGNTITFFTREYVVGNR